MKEIGSDSVAPLSAPEAGHSICVPSTREGTLESYLATYLETASVEEKEILQNQEAGRRIRARVFKELRDMGALLSILVRTSEATQEEAQRWGIPAGQTLLTDRVGAAVRGAILKEELRTDPLTRASSIHAYQEDVAESMKESLETGSSLWCIAADVDGLKKINDVFGHDVGNKILRMLTERMNGAIRHSDSVYRVGGDEFIILSDAQNEEEAQAIAERLLSAVSSKVFAVEAENGRKLISVSISLGISRFEPDRSTNMAEGKETMETSADRSLYIAKSKGRNRVVLGKG